MHAVRMSCCCCCTRPCVICVMCMYACVRVRASVSVCGRENLRAYDAFAVKTRQWHFCQTPGSRIIVTLGFSEISRGCRAAREIFIDDRRKSNDCTYFLLTRQLIFRLFRELSSFGPSIFSESAEKFCQSGACVRLYNTRSDNNTRKHTRINNLFAIENSIYGILHHREFLINKTLKHFRLQVIVYNKYKLITVDKLFLFTM